MADGLIIDIRAGEQLVISGEQEIRLELVHKSGRLARIRIAAPDDVRINHSKVEVIEDGKPI